MYLVRYVILQILPEKYLNTASNTEHVNTNTKYSENI